MHRDIDRLRPGLAHRQAFETGLLNYSVDDADALRATLAGTATTPFDAGYAEDRMGFMHTYQHYPQIIVHCVTVADVQLALAFARQKGLKATARSGGHSTAGYSVNDQLVIDVGGLSQVAIDVAQRTARVGPGTNFRKLNQELEGVGLHVPSGGCETVCVAGYMQGGGYGFTSRLFGLNCDCVRAVTLVLADGRVVQASATSEAELFWAVRGGTGNQFGVLVEVEYDLVPLATLWGFGLKWPLRSEADKATAAEVLALLQSGYSSAAGAPDDVGLQALLINVPTHDAPTGQVPHLLLRGLCNGSEAHTRDRLAPLIARLADPKAQIELWQAGSYRHLNEILLQTVDPAGLDLPTVSPNTQALTDSRIVTDFLSPQRWREVIDLFLEAPSRTTFFAIEFYGGAINRRAPDDCAFVHRRDSLNLFTWVFWTFEAHERAARAWLERFGRLGGHLGSGRRCQNYPLRGTRDFARSYFGDNLGRLVALKRATDPDDLFAYEQGLMAATAKGRDH